MNFLFVCRDDGGQTTTKAGFSGVIGKEVWAEARPTFHDALFPSVGIKVRMLDDFPSMVLLHHAGLVIKCRGCLADVVAPLGAR